MWQRYVLLLLACLCAAGSVRGNLPAPVTAFSSGSYLSRATDDKSVTTVQALEELFSAVAGTASGAPAALSGILDPQQLAEQRPDAVVVIASKAEGCSDAVRSKLVELTGAASSHMQLDNAMHEGASHPVFAALRRSARHLRVRVLGTCGATLAGSGPATPAALRAELEGAAGSDKPTVVVVCPEARDAAAAGSKEGVESVVYEVGSDEEAELLGAAAQLLAELAPGKHLLVHTSRHALKETRPYEQQRRRRLMEAHAMARSSESAANRTQNYTVCDATCHKHVMWFQGLIVLVVVLMALCVGCTCMHMVDVPTRFAQPEASSRQHQD